MNNINMVAIIATQIYAAALLVSSTLADSMAHKSIIMAAVAITAITWARFALPEKNK